MSAQARRLLDKLSDGKWHSGQALGEVLSVTRAAIWKHVQSIQELGFDVQSAKGQGYRIEGGVSLLATADTIEKALALAGYPLDVQRLEQVESTNQMLLEQLSAQKTIHRRAILAEQQLNGRGRRGRRWESPYARNIYLSLGWRFEGGATAMQGLSLAVSVAIAQVLHEQFGLQIELKWPNDVLYQGRKLGGILLEVSGDLSGVCCVVVGVGLNVSMPCSVGDKIDQPWVCLDECVKALNASLLPEALNRTDLSIAILVKLAALLEDFSLNGFCGYKQQWESFCPHMQKLVVVTSASESIEGKMVGISNMGELLLDIPSQQGCITRSFSGGEVSLRQVK